MIQLILGGTRSGKSVFAESQIQLLEQQFPKALVSYIATAELFDQGMKDRAKSHALRRPQHWQLIESPLELSKTLDSLDDQNRIILVDCLTLWLNNQMYYQTKESPSQKINLQQTFDDLLHCLSKHKANIVLVSNEVGLGILPMDKSTREFADYSGVLNQSIAKIANQAYLVTAGLPIKLKG